jgi:DNA mismatch repair protein MutS2
MDSHSLELLEFDKVRTLLAARAACSLGKSAARRIEPSVDPGEIHNRLALTTEMVEAMAAGLRPSFGGLHDVRALVRRSQQGSVLEAEELGQIVDTLRAIGHLDRWLSHVADRFPRLGGLRAGLGEFSAVVAAIDGCLDSRGKIVDTASRRLAGLRREIARSEERIQETLRRLLRTPEIRRALRYPNFTMVGHHYVLPVAKDRRGEVQGSVLRTSSSNETVYIEPTAIGELSAERSYLRDRELKEVRRILRWLTAQVAMVSESLLAAIETMTELDLIHARARLSADYQMTPPLFNQDGRLVLRSARHPLLEALFRGDGVAVDAPTARPRAVAEQSSASPSAAEPGQATPDGTAAIEPPAPSPDAPAPPPRTVTPIDLTLGVGYRTLVITGPNTGGKTVALKTAGLLAFMAQAGFHIPAAPGAQLPVFDDVLTDIGDEQSLEQSLSTFSSHVRRISEILSRATSTSLVLLDELGAGTDPADGAALGHAILDELEHLGCRSIVTTHIGDLKTYALSNPTAENAAVEFDHETLRPMYRLRVGDVGQSNALAIARHLRLPERVVERAEFYLAQRPSRDGPEWEAIQKLRAETESARQAAIEAQAEAERTREALSQRLAQLHEESRSAEVMAGARALLQPGDRVVVPRLGYDRPGRVVKLDPRKKTAVVAIGHVTWNVAIDELVPQTIRTPQAPLP